VLLQCSFNIFPSLYHRIKLTSEGAVTFITAAFVLITLLLTIIICWFVEIYSYIWYLNNLSNPIFLSFCCIKVTFKGCNIWSSNICSNNYFFLVLYNNTFSHTYHILTQSSWSKGIYETKSKQQSPCSNCMHRPVTSWADHMHLLHGIKSFKFVSDLPLPPATLILTYVFKKQFH
jgi:hypothetical protein